MMNNSFCRRLKKQFQDLKCLTELLEHLKSYSLAFLINTQAPNRQVNTLQASKGSNYSFIKQLKFEFLMSLKAHLEMDLILWHQGLELIVLSSKIDESFTRVRKNSDTAAQLSSF